jgi:uncharacterized membrane protein
MIFNGNYIGIFRRNRVNKSDRPVLKPEMAAADWLLEAAALLGLMILAGYVIYYFPRLPGTIPSHFNGAGQPDGFSAKASFWMLPGVAVFIYILLSLIVLVPHQFNYSIKITPANALKQYSMAIRLIRYLKAAVIWLFFYITYATVRVVEGKDSGMGLWFLPITLGGILIPLILYFIAAFRNR